MTRQSKWLPDQLVAAILTTLVTLVLLMTYGRLIAPNPMLPSDTGSASANPSIDGTYAGYVGFIHAVVGDLAAARAATPMPVPLALGGMPLGVSLTLGNRRAGGYSVSGHIELLQSPAFFERDRIQATVVPNPFNGRFLPIDYPIGPRLAGTFSTASSSLVLWTDAVPNGEGPGGTTATYRLEADNVSFDDGTIRGRFYQQVDGVGVGSTFLVGDVALSRIPVPAMPTMRSFIPTATPRGGVVPTATPQGGGSSGTVALKRSWNLVALPLSSSIRTAQQACDSIESSGGDADEVASWTQGGWVSHRCGLPFNNFATDLGKGYFIKVARDSEWRIAGTSVQSPVAIAVNEPWVSIAIPHTGSYTARSLCTAMQAQGIEAAEVQRWDGEWQGHSCGRPFNDFAIEVGRGYFVKVTRGFGAGVTFTP